MGLPAELWGAETSRVETPDQCVLRAFLEMADAASSKRPLSTVDALRSRYAADFLGFASLLEVLPKDVADGGPVPFVLTPIQRLWVTGHSGRDIALKARQVGLTTVEQARDLWFWLCHKGAAVRVICQSMTDHGAKNDLSKRFGIMLAALKKKGLQLVLEAEAVGRWLLPDSAGGGVMEIIEAGASKAAAEKKGRGGTTQRLHVTELAFFEYAGTTLKAMKQSVPKLESGSEITYESTPNGMGSENEGVDEQAAHDVSGGAMFYRAWIGAESGRNEFKPHFFPWYLNPEYRLPLEPGDDLEPRTDREHQLATLDLELEQLKWYRAQVAESGQDDTDQEYPTDPRSCFLASGRPFFDKGRTDTLMAAASEPIETRQIRRPGAVGTVRIFRRPALGAHYVIPADTSEGTGGDRGGGQVWERGTGRHMATLLGQFKPAELATELARLGVEYNTATIAVERNNHGHACLQELDRAGGNEDGSPKARYSRIYRDSDHKLGWLTSLLTRPVALDALEQAHRTGAWSSPDAQTIGEMRTFIVHKDGKPAARAGCFDELVMMAAIGLDVLRRSLAPSATRGGGVTTFDPDNVSGFG